MNKNKIYFMFKNKFLQSDPDFIQLQKIRNIELFCYHLIDNVRLKIIKKIVASKMNTIIEIETYHSSIEDSIRGMIYDRFRV